jgi:hypothetical protein
MPRLPLLSVLLLLLLILSFTSCGYVAVSGAILPGAQTATGLVSIVHFTFVDGMSSVTIVTLIGGGTANTFHFCGDQREQFPMDQNVSAQFSPGTSCDNVISVTFH